MAEIQTETLAALAASRPLNPVAAFANRKSSFGRGTLDVILIEWTSRNDCPSQGSTRAKQHNPVLLHQSEYTSLVV